MKEIIDRMVAQVEAREATQAVIDSRMEAEFVAEADAAIAEALSGGLWDAFKPNIAKRSIGHTHLRYLVEGDGLRALEIAPFWIHYDQGAHYEYEVRLSERETSKDILAVSEFLTSRRRAFHVDLERRNKEESTDLRDRLTSAVWDPMTPEEAGKMLARLIELYPQGEAKWLKAHRVSQEIRARWLARQAEAARLADLADGYHFAYSTWQQECARITKTNVVALGELQKELDGPFEVWRVTYSIAASEDNYAFAETADRYVTTSEPDEDGIWSVYLAGKMMPTKFFNPVFVEGPISFTPSANEPSFLRVGAPCDSPVGGARLYAYYDCNTTTRSEASGLVANRTLSYPPAPTMPDGLDEHDVDAAIRRAEEVVKDG